MSTTYTRLSGRQRLDILLDTRGGAIWVALIGAVIYAVGLGLAFASPVSLQVPAPAAAHHAPHA
jgi:hypothetical protein